MGSWRHVLSPSLDGPAAKPSEPLSLFDGLMLTSTDTQDRVRFNSHYFGLVVSSHCFANVDNEMVYVVKHLVLVGQLESLDRNYKQLAQSLVISIKAGVNKLEQTPH